MNIFYLDENPVLAAQAMCDKHISKMTLESAQILSTIIRQKPIFADSVYQQYDPVLSDLMNGLYKATHGNHPCITWVAEHRSNREWFLLHAESIAQEFHFRFGKPHKSAQIIQRAKNIFDLAETINMVDVIHDAPQCMPKPYRIAGNTVQAYRDYYVGEKAYFAKWEHGREAPEWWPL